MESRSPLRRDRPTETPECQTDCVSPAAPVEESEVKGYKRNRGCGRLFEQHAVPAQVKDVVPSRADTALKFLLLLWHLVKLDAAEREELYYFDLALLFAMKHEEIGQQTRRAIIPSLIVSETICLFLNSSNPAGNLIVGLSFQKSSRWNRGDRHTLVAQRLSCDLNVFVRPSSGRKAMAKALSQCARVIRRCRNRSLHLQLPFPSRQRRLTP